MRKVAIITGASSGLGEATALALAAKDVSVVLAARRENLLEQIAEQCRSLGVEALVVPADVSKAEEVARVAQAARDHFGRFDIWINNAGVTAVASFTDMPAEEFRRVIEVNFFGYVYGAREALRQFSEQGSGMLLNVSSVFGAVPAPYESSYIASKFAIRGWSASLREELLLTGQPDIHICTVLPSAIDTPIYRNAANLSHRVVKPPAPVYRAQKVVSAILSAIENPRPEIIVGGSGHMLSALYAVLPKDVFERLFATYINTSHFVPKHARNHKGNLYKPGTYAGVSGHWRRRPRKILYGGFAVSLFLVVLLLKRKHAKGGSA